MRASIYSRHLLLFVAAGLGACGGEMDDLD